MYKAVLFDLDDTLINLKETEAAALRVALDDQRLVLETDEETVLAAYREAVEPYWKERRERWLTRQQVVEYALRDVLHQLGAESALAPGLAAGYWRAFPRNPVLNPGVPDLLRGLSSRHKLGIVANGEDEFHRGRLRHAGMLPFFSTVAISDEAGAEKPNADIFQVALEQLGLGAKEVLYVGDSVEEDYAGSQNAGLDFGYYAPDPIPHDLENAAFQLRHFDELTKALCPVTA